MAALLGLPHEILHHIFAQTGPRDLASLTLCCRELSTFIPGNRLLWRDVYNHNYDEPPDVPGTIREDCSWEDELHGLVTMENVLNGSDDVEKKLNFRSFGEKIIRLIRNARPSNSANVRLLSKFFNNPLSRISKSNREILFCNSALFNRLANASSLGPHDIPSWEDRQLSAKLHSLFGIPVEKFGQYETRSSRTYPYACSKVYDLRNYTDGTMWGPFMEDGSGNVDWERVEAILIVLGHNFKLFSERTGGQFRYPWDKAFIESVPNSYVSSSGPRPQALSTALDLKDPYGITGRWMRIVTFLDFTELFAYNFAFGRPAANEPRVPLDTIEAIRLITMDVKVTKIEAPGPEDGQALPVVYFEGISRSMHTNLDPNANSGIRGHVKLTKEGEVRWTSFSIYQGEERWRSEGIQIGGPRSARGVIGNWFDKDFDVHGPAGPTAYWKVSDEIVDAEDSEDGEFSVDSPGPAYHVHDSESEGEDENEGAEENGEGGGGGQNGNDGEDSGDSGDEDGVTHQALLDMIQHIHTHHNGGVGNALLNEDGVFTGLNGIGIQVVLEETDEIVDDEEEGVVEGNPSVHGQNGQS